MSLVRWLTDLNMKRRRSNLRARRGHLEYKIDAYGKPGMTAATPHTVNRWRNELREVEQQLSDLESATRRERSSRAG